MHRIRTPLTTRPRFGHKVTLPSKRKHLKTQAVSGSLPSHSRQQHLDDCSGRKAEQTRGVKRWHYITPCNLDASGSSRKMYQFMHQQKALVFSKRCPHCTTVCVNYWLGTIFFFYFFFDQHNLSPYYDSGANSTRRLTASSVVTQRDTHGELGFQRKPYKGTVSEITCTLNVLPCTREVLNVIGGEWHQLTQSSSP